ncbi:recombinase family protein [Virgibacillus halodenitrificans]|uniref:recombinase family protein n=1 Tax=Virgibacillus halodenitrificans TaxID=1482 RepID=UPI001FB319EB|nr:recombinase family protein [Virgibacillus halodenitrificans]MCJ0932583.1 recombinase family protein [Virgibacillus halodenitrificans]
MKAALYIRVSTKEQIENYSIPSQKERLEAYCKSKDWELYETYIDPGHSGATMDRPNLQQMIKDINNFDVIVVYKLDRLSRSQRHTLELIEDHFLKNKVNFASVTENLDTSTPMGRAMIGIMSAFAQLEREMIAERMRNGHIKRAEEGLRVMGGDYDPAGYKRKSGTLIAVQEEKEHIQKAFDLYEQHLSITKVQSELKLLGYPVWRFRRYRDILSNKLYTGYVTFAGAYYRGKHEAFISEEQFKRVQTLLDRHKGANANKAKESLLSGLLTCGCCGESFVTYSSQDKRNGKLYKYRYYICKARRFPSEYPEKCLNKNWNAKKLEQVIIEEIKHLAVTREFKKDSGKKIDFSSQLNKIDKQIERLLPLYLEEKIKKEILDKQVEILTVQREELQERQKSEEAEKDELTEEQLKNYVIDLTESEFHIKQAAIRKLIKSITLVNEDVEIEWAF